MSQEDSNNVPPPTEEDETERSEMTEFLAEVVAARASRDDSTEETEDTEKKEAVAKAVEDAQKASTASDERAKSTERSTKTLEFERCLQEKSVLCISRPASRPSLVAQVGAAFAKEGLKESEPPMTEPTSGGEGAPHVESGALASSVSASNEIPGSERASNNTQTSRVGAFAMVPGTDGDVEQGYEEFSVTLDSHSAAGSAGIIEVNDVQSVDDAMVNATLVDDDAVVEAEKAPEGFKALISNNRFKHLVAAILIVMIVVIVPVAILVPKNRETAPVLPEFHCGTAHTNQADYRGVINVTASGVPCQPWASQFPNSHEFFPERYPAADLSENYCE